MSAIDEEIDHEIRRGAGLLAVVELLHEKGVLTDADVGSLGSRAEAVYQRVKRQYREMVEASHERVMDAMREAAKNGKLPPVVLEAVRKSILESGAKE